MNLFDKFIAGAAIVTGIATVGRLILKFIFLKKKKNREEEKKK